MIKITDKFSIKAEKRYWTLIEITGARWSEKKEAEVEQKRETYHSTLRQCANAIIDRECRNSENLKDLVAALDRSDFVCNSIFSNQES